MSEENNNSSVSTDLAYFNKLIYDVPVSEWNPYLKQHGYDYQVDTSLSQPDTAVLINKKTMKTVTVHSGTNMKERPISDLTTDAYIAMDLTGMSSRYKKAKSIQQRVLSKYPNFKHSTTGFSLGGAVANQIAHELDIDSQVFNPGVSPIVFKRRLDEQGKNRLFKRPKQGKASHRIHLTKGDWISNSGYMGIYGDEDLEFNTAKSDSSSMAGKAHAIENWIPQRNDSPPHVQPTAAAVHSSVHKSKRKRKPLT